jgi:hypothetical protein
MFQCLNILGSKQQGLSEVSELPVKLSMPDGYQNKAVSTSLFMKELLWQQYGMDVIHPEVSRWLELNAPDVKYAAVDNQLSESDDSAPFNVDPNGTIELHLPLEIDDRLREVSTQYFLSQIRHSIEPDTESRLQAA